VGTADLDASAHAEFGVEPGLGIRHPAAPIPGPVREAILARDAARQE
jgi:hypothetical protein